MKRSNVRSLHHFLGETLDFSDGSWSSLLEGDAIKTLAHVNSVISGDDITALCSWLSLSSCCFHHFPLKHKNSFLLCGWLERAWQIVKLKLNLILKNTVKMT